MVNTSYSKADLLWEATRRNEEYKIFYNEVAGPISEPESKWNRIWHPGNYRWKIHGLLHPSLSIDDIRAKIENGTDPNEVHPYHYMFEYEQNIITQHHVPKIESEYYDNPNRPQESVKIDSDAYRRYQEFKTIVKDRILLSIDPMARDEDIIAEIKKLKKGKRTALKHELNTLRAKGKRSYYPRDINKYIGWLSKYTEIVEYLAQKVGVQGLTISDGVVALPSDFRFSDMVPSNTPGKKFEGQVKAYREAYKGAVDLIQSSPDITFRAHRTQK